MKAAEFRREQRYWKERAAIALRGKAVTPLMVGYRSMFRNKKLRGSATDKTRQQAKARSKARRATKLRREQRQHLTRR